LLERDDGHRSKGGYEVSFNAARFADRADVAVGTLYRFSLPRVHLLSPRLGRGSSESAQPYRSGDDPAAHPTNF